MEFYLCFIVMMLGFKRLDRSRTLLDAHEVMICGGWDCQMHSDRLVKLPTCPVPEHHYWCCGQPKLKVMYYLGYSLVSA